MTARPFRCCPLVAIIAVAAMSPLARGQTEPMVKRLNCDSEQELREQLRYTPEIGLSQANAKSMYGIVTNKLTKSYFPNIDPDIGPKIYALQATKQKRPDFFAINWRRGNDCQLNPDLAAKLGTRSTALRRHIQRATTKDGLSATSLSELLDKDKDKGKDEAIDWSDPSAVPALTQMLQPEAEPIRQQLVDRLAAISGKSASEALAKRALFDLSLDVRRQALDALKNRPAAEYQDVLLDGFRWPWTPVFENAAEAVAILQLKSAEKELTTIKDEPDPRVMFEKDRLLFVNEVVKINHLSNCILCHAPSHNDKDPVRGRIPQPGEPLPSLYYQDPTGIFVRADTTYLRQDFSVVQTVSNPDKWPEQQRFDYFLRTRLASPTEVNDYKKSLAKREAPDDRRTQAIDFALESIGVDLGPEPQALSRPSPMKKAVRR